MDKGICCIVIALFDAAKEKKKREKNRNKLNVYS